MTIPLSPNFSPSSNAGRLATDRYDFEKHIEGISFRHNATQIDLSPPITINSQTTTKVQDAIAALANFISVNVPDATSSQKGIIQLNGDLGGTAPSPTVVGLQGRPISTLPPTTGQVLSWTGSAWAPASSSGTFTPNGDLSGNSFAQNVIGLTGVSGVVAVHGNRIHFDVNSVPLIDQQDNPSNSGTPLNILAQASLMPGGNGGNVFISGGAAGTGGLNGGATLGLGTGDNLVQVTEVAAGRRVLSLLDPNLLTITDMPSGTGDMVAYVRNAATAPSSGNPANGVIVYALAGQLRVKQSDGSDFVVGSTFLPNPIIWGGSLNNQEYTIRSRVTSTAGTPAFDVAADFTVPVNGSVNVKVTAVGKEVATGETAQFEMRFGFDRMTGSTSSVGTLSILDSRTTTGASSWTIPDIILVASNNIRVLSGFSASTSINWTIIVKLTTTTD